MSTVHREQEFRRRLEQAPSMPENMTRTELCRLVASSEDLPEEEYQILCRVAQEMGIHVLS